MNISLVQERDKESLISRSAKLKRETFIIDKAKIAMV
jgi:hypothetical protein